MSNKNMIRILSIITIFILILAGLYKVAWVFGWLAAALLITTLLAPITNFLQRYSPKKSRGLAVFGTFLVVILGFIILGLIILPPIINELVAMAKQIPNWIEAAKQNQQLAVIFTQAENQTAKASATGIYSFVGDAYNYVIGSVTGVVSSVSGMIFAIITIVTLCFFMLLNTDSVINGISYYLPDNKQNMFKRLSGELFSLISKYFAGVLIVGIIAGIAAYLPLVILGMPYAAALAVTVAALDLIPMVGATIGGAIVVIVCLLSGNTTAAVVMTLYFVIYQQIENNLVIPLVQKQTVKISPLGILIALLIGGALAGIIGTLLAIPAAAFIKIVYETLKTEGTLGEKAQLSTRKE